MIGIDRIEKALRDAGRSPKPRSDWQDMVWAKIERHRRQRWPSRALDAALRWLLRAIG